jgi:hypothetical protein
MAKASAPIGDVLRHLTDSLDRMRELDRLYLIKRAKLFRLPPPDSPERIIEILLRVARRRDPAYRKTVEEMTRPPHRPRGSRNNKGR